MFINAIDPTLLKIGFLEIRFYGIVYVLGFLLSYYILNKNREKLKLSRKQVDNLSFYFLIGLIIGARIFHFLFNDISVFYNDPLELFKLWHGGMSFYGGFLGALIASYLYLKNRLIDFADVIVIPVSFALILARFANFLNSEIVGTVTNLPWCVVFTVYDQLCRHPYQLYGVVSLSLLFAVLLIIRKQKVRKGVLFLSFIAGYSLLRIITDFFREDLRLLGLTPWQYVSIIILIVAFVVYRKVYKRV